MVGYVFLDMSNNLLYRVESYIKENPGFLSQNQNLLSKHWKFDTESYKSMFSLFSDFTNLQIPVSNVRDFISSIGYDMSRLKKETVNENKI